MTPPAPHNPGLPPNAANAACPAMIDLAAYADGRLSGDELERLDVHIAQCETCLQLVHELAADAPLIESESRMLIVPESVMRAAMDLRSADERSVPTLHVQRTSSRWIVGMRRGLAAAAAIGVVLGGYQIGQSFTASASPVIVASADASLMDESAFAILATSSSEDDDDLFTMAFDDVAEAKVVTP